MSARNYSSLITGDSTYNGMGMFGTAAPAGPTAGGNYDLFAQPASAGSSATLGGFATSAGGALSITGAIAGAIGSYYSAKAQKQTLKHQARMAEINARMVELGRRSALLQGQRAEQNIKMKAGQTKASQRVAFAANGIDMQSDTAQAIFNTADYVTEVDVITTQNNARMAAFGYAVESGNLTASAAVSRADASAVSPLSAAASSLIGSASNVAQRWNAYAKLR